MYWKLWKALGFKNETKFSTKFVSWGLDCTLHVFTHDTEHVGHCTEQCERHWVWKMRLDSAPDLFRLAPSLYTTCFHTWHGPHFTLHVFTHGMDHEFWGILFLNISFKVHPAPPPLIHIVKDVMWSFFSSRDPSIYPSVPSSIHGWHHTKKKTLAEINTPPLHVSLSRKGMPGPRGSDIYMPRNAQGIEKPKKNNKYNKIWCF